MFSLLVLVVFGMGLTRRSLAVLRTTAVEVGMQNWGPAAAQYVNPRATLPATVFTVWHKLSGAPSTLLRRRADARRIRA